MLEFVSNRRELYIGLGEIERAYPSRMTKMGVPAPRYRIYVLNTISLHVVGSTILEMIKIYVKQRRIANWTV
jgi:hypothetical protein